MKLKYTALPIVKNNAENLKKWGKKLLKESKKLKRQFGTWQSITRDRPQAVHGGDLRSTLFWSCMVVNSRCGALAERVHIHFHVASDSVHTDTSTPNFLIFWTTLLRCSVYSDVHSTHPQIQTQSVQVVKQQHCCVSSCPTMHMIISNQSVTFLASVESVALIH